MDSTPKPATPAYIGHYQLLEPIGRGGMGLVFRARDTRLEREVAIKCLRTELFRDSHAEFEDHYIERFKREALLLAKLNHPNIVQIYDFIEAPEQLALVMELVDGQNLQTYLREHIAPMSQRLHWLTQIAEGLAIAHDAGIIHRDLKAENILINKRGQAKITDLGIAKSQDFNVTLTDHVAGSYCSMSPEQAMGENISFKSDLFSLGILAYQLLCGAHPFGDTSNKLQIMQRIISHPPTPPHKHNPELPAEFVDLLGQLLSKDPNKRPDNTHWVAAQFAKLSQLQFGTMASDDTQVLAMPQPNTNNNGISRSARTQDHPTFETRFVAVAAPKISLWKKLKGYIATNKIVVSSATVSLALIAGIIVWQLQPKPPKYVAVIPPKLTAEGMQESQQELVKGTVYDAIQQAVTQLENHYLIPTQETEQFPTTITAQQQATNADELIDTIVDCNIDTCKIHISRINGHVKNGEVTRPITIKSKHIDVVTDNVLLVADSIQKGISSLYEQNLAYTTANLTQINYENFIATKLYYLKYGANEKLLGALENISQSRINYAPLKTLYIDIALDLYHETRDPLFLEKAKTVLQFFPSSESNSLIFLHSFFYISISEQDFEKANEIFKKIAKIEPSQSALFELQGYLKVAQRDYDGAITAYKKAIQIRKTAYNLYYLANAFWYAGTNDQAKSLIRESLKLAPDYYKSYSLLALIALYNGEIPVAIENFEKVIQLNPSDVENLNNAGLVYLLDKQYEKARNSFNSALTIEPKNATLLLNIADVDLLSGSIESAHDGYKKVISATVDLPRNNQSARNLSQAFAHLGDYLSALQELKILEELDPQNVETKYTAALVHTLAGNYSSATLSARQTVEGGLHPIWFSFDWFQPLCNQNEFIKLVPNGEGNACLPH
jgi:serine/threonine protein kinase/tetratricopeptide (TPR) repeat protein